MRERNDLETQSMSGEQLSVLKLSSHDCKLQLLQSPPPASKLGWNVQPKQNFSTPNNKRLAVVPYVKNGAPSKAGVTVGPAHNDGFEPMMMSADLVDSSMVMTESPVEFQPSGAWARRKITVVPAHEDSNEPAANIDKSYFMISTSFMSQGVSIDCRSAADAVAILCMGISKIRVLYVADDTVHSTKDRICVRDLIASDFHSMHHPASTSEEEEEEARGQSSSSSSSSAELQYIAFNTPWPCKKVEVMVTQKSHEFVSVFDVATYSSRIRSSSLSTPTIQKMRSSSMASWS